MSIQGEIDRIKGNLAGAYSAVEEMGGTLPEQQVSGNLAEAIRSIPSGGSPTTPLDPMEVYKATRPADWLPMPEPQDNEMYLLFHIPDGVSSLLAFTVTCTGSYTVALGTVTDGQFVQQSAISMASGSKYEAELSADDFGNLTSDGFKQVMVKVSGTDILTWESSTHSKKTSPSDFVAWCIVEIACRLQNGKRVVCGKTHSIESALSRLRYFSWYGTNNMTISESMFRNCISLIAILRIDISKVTNANQMFTSCHNLTAIPQLDTSKVTNTGYMFSECRSLTAIPQLDISNVTYAYFMFGYASCLTTIPQLNTSKVTEISSMFRNCYSLVEIPQLDTSNVSNALLMVYGCYNLAKFKLNPTVTGWIGQDINMDGCSLDHQALVDLFNSLPTITSTKALTLTGNPGVSELTDAEKAIATNKNWTLTL